MSNRQLEIFRHIREHGGPIVGEKSLGAWRDAKRAYQAELLGFRVTWEYEQEDWMIFSGDPEEEYRAKFESGEWECFRAYVKDDDGNYLASLGGVILGSRDKRYRQCVEFELLAEAYPEMLKGNAT